MKGVTLVWLNRWCLRKWLELFSTETAVIPVVHDLVLCKQYMRELHQSTGLLWRSASLELTGILKDSLDYCLLLSSLTGNRSMMLFSLSDMGFRCWFPHVAFLKLANKAELLTEFELLSCYDAMSFFVPVLDHHDWSKDWLLFFCMRLSYHFSVSKLSSDKRDLGIVGCHDKEAGQCSIASPRLILENWTNRTSICHRGSSALGAPLLYHRKPRADSAAESIVSWRCGPFCDEPRNEWHIARFHSHMSRGISVSLALSILLLISCFRVEQHSSELDQWITKIAPLRLTDALWANTGHNVAHLTWVYRDGCLQKYERPVIVCSYFISVRRARVKWTVWPWYSCTSKSIELAVDSVVVAPPPGHRCEHQPLPRTKLMFRRSQVQSQAWWCLTECCFSVCESMRQFPPESNMVPTILSTIFQSFGFGLISKSSKGIWITGTLSLRWEARTGSLLSWYDHIEREERYTSDPWYSVTIWRSWSRESP